MCCSSAEPRKIPAAPGRGWGIGGLRLPSPFLLAPMAGVTDRPFRAMAIAEGAALTYSEMASAAALSHRGKKTIRLLSHHGENVPFAVQLFGKLPSELAEAARIATLEHGASLIDINMACPARKVLRSGHGAALLSQPSLCLGLCESVARAVDVPLTVKCRPGLAPPEGGREPQVYELAKGLESAGVRAVALHPRYASQGFRGQADWSLVKGLSERVGITVIGSGDIDSPESALLRLKDSGASLVMLGRAVRGRPWLFGQCLDLLGEGSYSEPTLSQRLGHALRHARLEHDELGPRAVFPLRSILPWYIKGLPGASGFRDRICHEADFGRQLDIVTEAFERAMRAGDGDGAEGDMGAQGARTGPSGHMARGGANGGERGGEGAS